MHRCDAAHSGKTVSCDSCAPRCRNRVASLETNRLTPGTYLTGVFAALLVTGAYHPVGDV